MNGGGSAGAAEGTSDARLPVGGWGRWFGEEARAAAVLYFFGCRTVASLCIALYWEVEWPTAGTRRAPCARLPMQPSSRHSR